MKGKNVAMKITPAQLRQIINEEAHRVTEGMDEFDRLFNQIVDALEELEATHGMDPQRIAMQAIKALQQRSR